MRDAQPESRTHVRSGAVSGIGLILLAACGSVPGPGPWVSEAGHRWRELGGPGRLPDGFTSLSPATTGINFANTVSDSAAQRNRHLMDGSGVALGDVNGDGRLDIYLCRIEGPNALYLNDGNW
ncbi:MAG TPA: VCBS repeat-containing protein, partial [Gemmatimonadales bacterium]|nr:VCBS repeat-containing protein [Gemmatimonadales bacterium]